MAKHELLNSIRLLSGKIDKLLEQQQRLQETIKKLETENFELKNQHDSDIQSLKKAQMEIEFLSLSHRLANTPEALISARKKISKLIKTVDSCIRMINED